MELSMVPYNDQVEAKPGRAELDRRQASAVAEAEAARYRECLRNHAAAIGGHTNDGCGEFMEGSASPLLCAACGCHRNFHRKELPAGGGLDGGELLGHPRQQYYLQHHYYQQNPHRSQPMVVYDGRYAAAAQMVAPMQAVVAAEEAGAAASARKRFRTRFTPEQKERMAEFAERRGWRLGGKREDEEELRRFCSEVGINRQVLKVWIHNHKHSLGSANACGGGGPKEEEEEEVVVAEPATPATMTP